MRKIGILYVILLCGFVLYPACSNKQDTGSIGYSSESDSFCANSESYCFPTEYYGQNGKVNYSIKNISFPAGELSKTEASQVIFDKEGLAKYLLRDVDCVYLADQNEYISKKWFDDPREIDLCTIDKFCYSSKEMSLVYDCYCDNEDFDDPVNYWLLKWREEKEFAFGSKENCLREIYSLLSKYGLDLDQYSFDIDTYYLDHTRLLSQSPQYTEDYYVFYFWQKSQGVKIISETGGYLRDPTENTINIVYGSNGIVYLSIDNIYDLNDEHITIDLMPFEEVINCVSQFLNQEDPETEYNIDNAILYLRAESENGNAELKPTWNFCMNYCRGGRMWKKERNFDATTGSFVPIKGPF